MKVFYFSCFRFSCIFLIWLAAYDVEGRQLECAYTTYSNTFWPQHNKCIVDKIEFSGQFISKEHTFSGSLSQKSEIKSFQIQYSNRIDFLPLEIIQEFPQLNGIIVASCNLPILKSGFFLQIFHVIEYLYLESNNIESVESNAFQHLVKLKWTSLASNKIEILPFGIFANKSELIYIDLSLNKIKSIHPDSFKNLHNLKLIIFGSGNACVQKNIGCESCSVLQLDIETELEICFKNCLKGSICFNSYIRKEYSQIQSNQSNYSSNETSFEVSCINQNFKFIEELKKVIAAEIKAIFEEVWKKNSGQIEGNF